MAGIGFELRKLMESQTYAGILRAYTVAGMVSSGPWVISILIIVALGFLSLTQSHDSHSVGAFPLSITYLVAASMLLTSTVQLAYTRFVADKIYLNQHEAILPSLTATLIPVNIVSAVIALVLLLTLFTDTKFLYQLEMFIGFILLCNIWILSIFLAGLKSYNAILWSFLAGYSIVLIGGILMRPFGLPGLMAAFCIGQAVLMYLLLWLVMRQYPSHQIAGFDIYKPRSIYYSLIFIGFFFNLGLWADKFMFWFNPATSIPVIGPLRASPIYDFPIFMAYLSIVPGMAVFLIRMETDFVEHYKNYYQAIRDGGTLEQIQEYCQDMKNSVRKGLYDIFKIQSITIILICIFAVPLVESLGFSKIYVPLLKIDLVGVGVQVLLLAIINTLFYLDKLKISLYLCLLFSASNLILTGLSQWLGAEYYGYGFAISTSMTALVGMILLSREFENLTYSTFMLQNSNTQRLQSRQAHNIPAQ